MPAIPGSLIPTIQGYAIGAPSGVRQVEVAGGASRFGLDWDAGRQPFQVRMLLDAERFSVWTVFYLHVIARGAVPFEMPLDSGFGLQDHTCNIVPGSYGATREGPHTAVSFQVEALSAAWAFTPEAAEEIIGDYNGYATANPPQIPRGFCPLISPYSFDGPGGVVRGDVEGGFAGYAPAWHRDVQRFSATMLLNAEQFSIWTLFLTHSIRKGALAFTMPLDSGMGVEPHSVTIIPGTVNAARNGNHWVVSFSVEAESSAYRLSAVDALALLNLYGEVGVGSSALLGRIAYFANQDTLVLQE